MTPRILVADDEADNRAIVLMALSAAGFAVLEAVNGQQAVAVAALSPRPDLILLDLAMPVLSGWDAVRLLKADPHTRSIPVWAYSAHALAGDERRALEAGCDGYVAKPCPPRELVARVRRLLGPGGERHG